MTRKKRKGQLNRRGAWEPGRERASSLSSPPAGLTPSIHFSLMPLLEKTPKASKLSLFLLLPSLSPSLHFPFWIKPPTLSLSPSLLPPSPALFFPRLDHTGLITICFSVISQRLYCQCNSIQSIGQPITVQSQPVPTQHIYTHTQRFGHNPVSLQP